MDKSEKFKTKQNTQIPFVFLEDKIQLKKKKKRLIEEQADNYCDISPPKTEVFV